MKFRRDMVVEVEFLDHVEDSGEPLRFTVYGRISGVHRKHLVIDSWAYTDDASSGDADSNVKRWTILRSTIVNAWELRRRKQ